MREMRYFQMDWATEEYYRQLEASEQANEPEDEGRPATDEEEDAANDAYYLARTRNFF